MKPVHLIGVPLDLGGGRRGVDMGPSAFRIAGLGDRSASSDTPSWPRQRAAPLRESGTPGDERKKYVDDIAGVCRRVYDAAREALEAGALPVVLGGDHSLAAGSVAASAAWVRQASSYPLGLIWVDAHGDMNTPETSGSGNVHGMPLAALLGREHASWQRSAAAPRLAAQQTVLVGIRNLDDRGEGSDSRRRVHVFTMKDTDRERYGPRG